MSEAPAKAEPTAPALAIAAVVAGLILTCLAGAWMQAYGRTALHPDYNQRAMEMADEGGDGWGQPPPVTREEISDPRVTRQLVGGSLLGLAALASLAGCWLGGRRSGWRLDGGLAILLIGLPSLPVQAYLLLRLG